MMVNVGSESVDRDDSSSASLPSDPTQDDSLPSHITTEDIQEDFDEERGPSPVGSDIWMPDSENQRKEMHAMILFRNGFSPKEIISMLYPNVQLPFDVKDSAAFRILSELVERPPKRVKLIAHNSFEDAVELFRNARRILVLTGAGVSVSCGIPDFRSKDGVYARLHISFPDLPDPSAMFDMQYFRKNPKPFYDFAKEIFPGAFEPSFSHKFIRQLEKKEKLLRNYTQNIDTLEKVAGIERVVECHGSFSSATCLECKTVYSPEDIRENVIQKCVAYCRECKTGVIKPDIVFFGESLHADFHTQMAKDKDEPDLVVVIGSSLKVRPVSLIPLAVPPECPQILINREPIPHYTPDIELLGNCDDILREIALAIGEEEFVMEYDKSHGKEQRKRRRKIPQDKFEEMIAELDEKESMKLDNESGPSEEGEKEVKRNHGENEDGESAAKKPRMSDPSALSNLYSMRYISLEGNIPEGAFLEVSTNQCVFPGAEIYIDMDTKVICQLPRRTPACGIRGSDDSDSNDSDCDECSIPSESHSLPPIPSSPSPPRSMRASSCLPSLDTQSLVPLNQLRSQVRQLTETDEWSEGDESSLSSTQ